MVGATLKIKTTSVYKALVVLSRAIYQISYKLVKNRSRHKINENNKKKLT